MDVGRVDGPDALFLRRNVQRFRGGLVFKAHRFLNHSTLGLRVIKKKKKRYHGCRESGWSRRGVRASTLALPLRVNKEVTTPL